MNISVCGGFNLGLSHLFPGGSFSAFLPVKYAANCRAGACSRRTLVTRLGNGGSKPPPYGLDATYTLQIIVVHYLGYTSGAADAAIRIFLKSFFKLTKAFKLQIVSVFLTSEGLLREI